MKTKDFNVSFFKPKTEYSRKNRNIIVWFLLIWFICIYGFHILLRVIEKPTKESSLITYEQVRDNYFSKTSTPEQDKLFIGSVASVLGKTLKPEHKKLLSEVITQAIFKNISDSVVRADLSNTLIQLENDIVKLTALQEMQPRPKNFREQKAEISEAISDKRAKIQMILSKQKAFLFAKDDKFANLKILYLPFMLTSAGYQPEYNPDIEQINKTMALYTTHNQSFLTNVKFLGFPFHYFYTAIFLLVLFVGLCLVYSIFMKNLNIKYQIQE